MPEDTIYADGRHYDSLFPGSKEAIRFWISRARVHGDPILELACGTGRLTNSMALAGFEVDGLDISDEMLSEAKRKSNEINVSVDYFQADLRNFMLDRQYSFILFPANSICHLLTNTDFETAMTSIRNHLRPDGIFMVEVFVPDLNMLTIENDHMAEFASYDEPDGIGKVIINYTSRYNRAEQIKYNTLFHKLPGQDGERVSYLPMRMYFPQELDALFHYNGFEIINKYGDEHMTTFDEHSSNQIFELKVKKT